MDTFILFLGIILCIIFSSLGIAFLISLGLVGFSIKVHVDGNYQLQQPKPAAEWRLIIDVLTASDDGSDVESNVDDSTVAATDGKEDPAVGGSQRRHIRQRSERLASNRKHLMTLEYVEKKSSANDQSRRQSKRSKGSIGGTDTGSLPVSENDAQDETKNSPRLLLRSNDLSAVVWNGSARRRPLATTIMSEAATASLILSYVKLAESETSRREMIGSEADAKFHWTLTIKNSQ